MEDSVTFYQGGSTTTCPNQLESYRHAVEHADNLADLCRVCEPADSDITLIGFSWNCPESFMKKRLKSRYQNGAEIREDYYS